ncbi:MAG: alpha-galactosidase [Clostridia bacterium]|nr:alpha-galactosidase [Clostridia bacterium]
MQINYGALYREQFENGTLSPVSYLERAPMDPQVTSMKASFGITVGGEDAHGLFTLCDAEGDNPRLESTPEGFDRYIVSLMDEKHGMQVDVRTELVKGLEASGQKTMARTLRIVNRGKEPLVLSDVVMMGGLVFQSRTSGESQPMRVGYMRSGCPGGEGDFHWNDMNQGRIAVANRTYTERYRLPFVALHHPAGGDYVLLNLAFSGGYEFEIEQSGEGVYAQKNLGFSVRFGGRAPVRVLAPGEEAVTPRLLLTFVHGSFDEAVNANLDFVRRMGSPYPKTCAVECSAMTNREDEVRFNLDAADRYGAEIVYIDAGWYIPRGKSLDDWPAYCGDWKRTPDTYESTLAQFRDRCRQAGKKFGLWMDMEKIGFFSQTHQSGKVTCLTGYDGKPFPDGPQAYMLDLTQDDNYNWALEQICYVLDTYDLDYFRLDSGVYATESYHWVLGYRENAAWRYYDRLYELFRFLRRKYPDVVFQNCAGGGMRADAGMTSIMSNTWISDVNHAPESFRIINGVSMVIPVEYCVKLVNGMGAENGCTDAFKLNVARFGSPLIPGSKPMLPDTFEPRLRAMLGTFCNTVRPRLPKALVYHHTPEVNLYGEGELGVLEIGSTELDFSMAAVFTLGPALPGQVRLTFWGIDPAMQYHVRANDHDLGDFSGVALQKGIPVEIEEMCDSVCFVAERI